GLEGHLQADERAEQAGEHEVAVLDPVDLDARLLGPEQVAGRRDRVQAPPGPGQQDVPEYDDDDGPDDLGPLAGADPVPDADHGLRDGHRLGVRGGVDQTQENETGAQGGDERGQAHRDGEEAVQPADRDPHEQADEDGQPAGEAVEVDQVVHEERREREDEADRQVDLAADQQEDLADRDDHDVGRVLRQPGRQVRGAVEVRGGHREVDNQRDRDHQHGRLALAQEGQTRRSQRATARGRI